MGTKLIFTIEHDGEVDVEHLALEASEALYEADGRVLDVVVSDEGDHTVAHMEVEGEL